MNKGNKTSISFDSEHFEDISEYLYSLSISRKKILIPVKASPCPNKIITTFCISCALEKGNDFSSLTWKTRLFPFEAFAVCCLLLMYAAAWVTFCVKIKQFQASSIIFLILFSSLVLLVIANYWWQYHSCNKQFMERITKKLTQNQASQGQSGDSQINREAVL